MIDQEGRKASYTHAMYLDDEGPIAGGREIWGFPKKLASPRLSVDGKDTLLGTLDYGTQPIATGTMGYKYRPLDLEAERAKLADSPNEDLPAAFRTSMLQSLEKGSITEIDFINAARSCAVGPASRCTTPVNATLVACIKGIERAMKDRLQAEAA